MTNVLSSNAHNVSPDSEDSDKMLDSVVTDSANENVDEVKTATVKTRSMLLRSVGDNLPDKETEFFNVEEPINDRVADSDTLAAEQRSCPTLCVYWELAKQKKGNFIIDSGLLIIMIRSWDTK